jgi:hypothetical protein
MQFTVEFHETSSGQCPVRDFLDDLKNSDPDDFASVFLYFFMKGRRIVAVHGIRHKGSKIPARDRETALERRNEWLSRNK